MAPSSSCAPKDIFRSAQVNDSEHALLSLVRGQRSEKFSITITRDGARWTVVHADREHKGADLEIATGNTFDEAWQTAALF